MRFTSVVILSLVGCTRVNTSTLPPFVRDVRAAVGGVELVQCEVIVTTKRENTFWDNNKTTREISMGNCWNQVVSTEPPVEAPVQFAPPQPPPLPVPPSPAPVRPGGVR
jgi:hypothetical protein